ncbi:hypothetical protein ABPG74_007431 [Tetrahymena malaccensis]
MSYNNTKNFISQTLKKESPRAFYAGSLPYYSMMFLSFNLNDESNISLTEGAIKEFLISKKCQIQSKIVTNAINFLKDQQYEVKELVNCGGFGLLFKALDVSKKNFVEIELLKIQDKASKLLNM